MTLRTTRQLTILNDHLLAPRLAGPHTICATGLPRGGTSSVALLLRELGLFMGDAPISFNHEDQRLQGARENAEAFAAIARDYDARHPVWAFKLPVGADMLKTLGPLLRNPVHIAVMRSPVATARSRMARQKNDDQGKFLSSVMRLQKEWLSYVKQARKVDAPVILVEYERLLTDPSAFAEELAAALAITTDEQTIARAAHAISTPGYQSFSGDSGEQRVEKPEVAARLFR